jgi:murein L,D-transpeptidase YcbB/YkuD
VHDAKAIPVRQWASLTQACDNHHGRAKYGTSLALGDGVKLFHSLILTLLLGASAAHAELRLEVDRDTRELSVYVDGSPSESFSVSVGKDSYPTPKGTFAIRKVIWNPAWKPPESKWAKGKTAKPPGHPDNPMKRVKMFFKEPDYYIHGTDADDSLGKAESHGCLRMSEEDVTRLARMVMEHGGKPMPEPWYRRIFRSRTTKVVYLTTPITIEIE